MGQIIDKTAEEAGQGFQILGAKKYEGKSSQPGSENISGDIKPDSGAVSGDGNQPMA